MSAFIVTPEHIAAIVKAYQRSKYAATNERQYFSAERWPLQLCALLYAENVRSVNHRYEDHTPDEPRVFTQRDLDKAPMLSPVAVLKLADSLEYQSCETEDYRTTRAWKALERIRGNMIATLPGYEAAQWSL